MYEITPAQAIAELAESIAKDSTWVDELMKDKEGNKELIAWHMENIEICHKSITSWFKKLKESQA